MKKKDVESQHQSQANWYEINHWREKKWRQILKFSVIMNIIKSKAWQFIPMAVTIYILRKLTKTEKKIETKTEHFGSYHMLAKYDTKS